MIALCSILAALQVTGQRPITIEVERNVEVTRNTEGGERRGLLYLDDTKSLPFRLTKGQRFEVVAVLQEGGCRRIPGQGIWPDFVPLA